MPCKDHQMYREGFKIIGTVGDTEHYRKPIPKMAKADDGSRFPILWQDRINIITETGYKRHCYVFSNPNKPEQNTVLKNGFPKKGDKVRGFCFPLNSRGDRRPCISWLEIL